MRVGRARPYPERRALLSRALQDRPKRAYAFSMPITLDEVEVFADQWFRTVASGGAAVAQAAFFLDPQSRIYVMQGGETIGFPDHETLHRQWFNERHVFGSFSITPLSTAPERVRA